MEGIIKKPYEISLWKDILTFVTDELDEFGQNKTYTSETIQDANGKVIAQYYEEQKLYIIGSNEMSSPTRAINPKLVTNINGSTSLTFSIYTRYYDEETEEFYQNPFIPLLTNERKIKLRYGAPGNCKWYDFIIKDIQEESENSMFTYIAKDLFVNELSKTGFDIELNAELENNMGTITELGEEILKNSDWKLQENNAIIRQFTPEPLYKIIVKKAYEAINMLDSNDKISLVAGDVIYSFYSIIQEQVPYFQFLYLPKDAAFEVDDNNVITNSPNYFINNMTYIDGVPDIAREITFSENYHGNRLVRKNKTIYDSTIDKYVQVYNYIDEKGQKSIAYGYTEDEYISPAAVQNYVTNPLSFDSTIGWNVGGIKNGGSETIYPELTVISFPDVRDISFVDIDKYGEYTTFLKYHSTLAGQTLVNSGIADYRAQINGFVQNEEYVFRAKIKIANAHNSEGRPSSMVPFLGNLSFSVKEYDLKDGVYTTKDTFFSGNLNSVQTDGYRQIIVRCKKSLAYSDMIVKQLGLFINLPTGQDYYIEEIQFFPYKTYQKETTGGGYTEEMCTPGGEIVSIVKTKYLYYKPNDNYKTIDDVFFLYEDYKPSNKFVEVHYENFEKIRSITASESNIFNLIQSLCETFECWVRFTIDHDNETGKILLDNDYRQKKWVGFYESITQPNFCGFKYGVNLKNIERNIDSDGIVSKIIVKNNSNEFAKNGFCNIARANSNETKENFILDFSYYIQQHMLGFNEITNDLYLDANGYLGYYKNLKKLNKNRDKYIEELAALTADIPKYESSYQTYKVSVDTAESKLRDQQIFLKQLTGYTLEQLIAQQNSSAQYWWKDIEAQGIINSIGRLKNIIFQHTKLRDAAKKNLEDAQKKKLDLENKLKKITDNKRELNLKFYKKYSRFIQEGSWISEDYIDDELYYLDAKSTLHTSSQPKVTYTINVLELSQLEGYENYTFALGDKTFIEDTKFFGWTMKEGIQTPYKEEIVVTELTINLDSPENNQIKVQNYRTQFEDLFQRITATTQAIEYSTGAYDKVSGIVQEDGTIAPTTLQNSIANNSLKLENAKDQSVVWDETGITTTSLSKPSEMLRIISGGIFLSTDGGVTWNTGITGSGINANYITSGQINTSEINIMNGAFPSFRWDKIGLSAYSFQIDENSKTAVAFDTSKFIRFDQYGLYGITGFPNFDPNAPTEEGQEGLDKINRYADFSLTWDGFKLKTHHTNEQDKGFINISSKDDIQVFNGKGIEQVKIGLLPSASETGFIYGLRINDSEGSPVLQSDSTGKLFLTQYLRIGPNAGATYTDRVRFGVLESYDVQHNIASNAEQKKFSKILSVKGVSDLNKKPDQNSPIRSKDEVITLYDDGTLIASQLIADNLRGKNVNIEGTINATGGKIGNLTIEEVESGGYSVRIISEDGIVFPQQDVGSKKLTAYLYKGETRVEPEKISRYEWFENEKIIDGATAQTLTVFANQIDGSVTYQCKIYLKEE